MKDKQRKIIAVFSVHWDILRAFCNKLQGFDKHKEASLIPYIKLPNISDFVTSNTNIKFNIRKWILILTLCYLFLQCLMPKL